MHVFGPKEESGEPGQNLGRRGENMQTFGQDFEPAARLP